MAEIESQKQIVRDKLATLAVPTPPGPKQPLRAGFAISLLNPPGTCPLGGFGGGDRRLGFPDLDPFNEHVMFRPNTGIHDNLRIKALVLDNGEQRVAIVGVDAIGATGFLCDAIAAEIAATGIDADHLIVGGTHTHSGPGAMADLPFWWFIAMDVFNQRVFDHSVGKVKEAIDLACSRLEPAVMGIGSGIETNVSRNRRTAGAPVDTEVGVIRVDRTNGTPIATLFNFAVHGTCLGSSNLEFTADIMGYAERRIEGTTGPNSVAIFINGAEGDVKPMHSSHAYADSLGTMLGDKVMAIRQNIPVTPDFNIAVHNIDLSLPRAQFQVNACDDEWLGWLPDWLTIDIDAFVEHTTRLTSFRFNNHALVTVPGEALTDIGMEIKRQGSLLGYDNVYVFGLSNGHISYIAPDYEFPNGGYEVCASIYGTGLGQLIVDTCVDAMRGVQPTPIPTETLTPSPTQPSTPTVPPTVVTPITTETPLVTHTPQPSTQTPVVTETPAPTATVSFTATPVDDRRPSIKLAGYMATDLSSYHGGELNLFAWCENSTGRVLNKVEVLYQGLPVGLSLPVHDLSQGIFWLRNLQIDSGATRGMYLFELEAVTIVNKHSYLWPYLNVN